ncbi:neprilysin-4-like [Drosophila takahashii]
MDLAESLNVSRELRVAQRFYNACLEADLHPFPAADPHYLKLIRSIGGFPAVDGAAWNSSNFSWFNMSAHLTNYGAQGLYDEMLPTLRGDTVGLVVNDLGFDATVKLDNMKKNSSRAYKRNERRMRGYLRSFNLTEDRITEVIDGVFAFWREALVAIKSEDWDSEFDITNYYKIAWNKEEEQWSYGSAFVELDKICARHPEAVANYLAMQLLYAFDANLKDVKDQRDYCTTKMRTSMWPLFKKLHLAENLSEEKRLGVLEIAQAIWNNWRKIVEEVDWLDSEARKDALLQVSRNPEFQFGTPADTSLTDQKIPEILRLEVVDDNYAATNMNLFRLKVDIERFRTRHSVEEGFMISQREMIMDFRENNTNHNLIAAFHGSFLEPPYYHRSWPHSLKFGTLGFEAGQYFTTVVT